MTIEYMFNYGDRVTANGKEGEITSMVPGDGKDPWYYIQFEDGTEDRYQADQIQRA